MPRPTEKERNLRRFTEQWAEFTETEEDFALTEFDDEDVGYVLDILRSDEPIGKYVRLATAMEV